MAGNATLKTVGPWVAVKQDEETTVVNDTQTGEALLATSYAEDHKAAVLAACAPELRDALKDVRETYRAAESLREALAGAGDIREALGEYAVPIDAALDALQDVDEAMARLDGLLRRCEGLGA